MRLQRHVRKLSLLALLLTTFLAGCDQGFVGDAARESFASFLTSLANTAVTETITPG